MQSNYDINTMDTYQSMTYTIPDLADEIKATTSQDRFANNLSEHLKKGTTPIKSKLTDWQHSDGIYRYQDKIYIPENSELRHKIIKTYHDSPHAGHPGRFKTLELVKRDYWWPGMNTTIKKWVEGCATCQQMKINTHPTRPGIQPIKSQATRPFQQVTCDFITNLPPSNGYDSIMVVVDHGLSKGVVYTPCTKKIDALGTAQIFIDQIWRRFGLPDVIISDRGPQFTAKVFQEMCQMLKINHRMSTAFHPQTDGETERVNQELETYLRIFCATEQRKWSDYLPMAEFAHNNRAHETSKMSPFQIIYGTDLKGIPTAFPRAQAPAVEDRLKEITKIRQEALAAHELARQLMIRRNPGNDIEFKVGDQVWLDARNLRFPVETPKFKPKRLGPFKILEKLSKRVY